MWATTMGKGGGLHLNKSLHHVWEGVVCSQNKGLEQSGNVCTAGITLSGWKCSQILGSYDSVGGEPILPLALINKCQRHR